MLNDESALPFDVQSILPGTLDLEVDPLTEYACDTAAWLDLLVDCGT